MRKREPTGVNGWSHRLGPSGLGSYLERQVPSASWRTARTNRRAMESLDSLVREAHTHCLVRRQGVEGFALVTTGFPAATPLRTSPLTSLPQHITGSGGAMTRGEATWPSAGAWVGGQCPLLVITQVAHPEGTQISDGGHSTTAHPPLGTYMQAASK